MTEPETKAERNARILGGFILDGEAACSDLMARAKVKLAEGDDEAAGRLHARWGRLTRRVMQAMVLDDKFDRMTAEDRRKAAEAAPRETDPQIRQRRADILAEFRIGGLDHDEEIELKDLLDEMDDDELMGYPLLEQLGRISQNLNWEPAQAVLEYARAFAAAEAAPPPEPAPEPAPKPAAPRLVASQGEQGRSEPHRSAIWRRQEAQIERERAAREAEARDRDTS